MHFRQAMSAHVIDDAIHLGAAEISDVEARIGGFGTQQNELPDGINDRMQLACVD